MNSLKLYFVGLLLLTVSGLKAQFTEIPDPIFEEFLISQFLDDVVDGQVLTANISDKTFLQINEVDPIFPIEDLTGIQDFTSLEVLLVEISNCVSIDFGDLENLELLAISLSENLTAIDVSGCSSLKELSVSGNNIETLDLSQNPNLIEVFASNNNLTSLDVRNNSNENIEIFFALNNPNLQCIFVDDAAFSTANWTNVNETTTFVETEAACEALSLGDLSVSSLNLYPNPTTDFFKVQAAARVQKIKIRDLSGKRIKTFVHPLETYHVADLTAGLYLVRIETTAGVSTHKLLLSR